MSFRISASSKYANPHPTPRSGNKKDNLLTDEDYMLFGLDGQSSSSSQSRAAPKAPRQGGHCIRDSHAQSDHY